MPNDEIAWGVEVRMLSSALKVARGSERRRRVCALTALATLLGMATPAAAQEKEAHECIEEHSAGLHPIDHGYKPTKFNLRKFKIQFNGSRARVRYDLSLNRADGNFTCSTPDEIRSGILQCTEDGQMFVFDKDQSKLHFAQLYVAGEGIPQAPLFVSTASCRRV
ncbi:hypothetical protein [Methylobacterium oxalidis]|nr:hypothetical protein [Methylobacterium oxalidis]